MCVCVRESERENAFSHTYSHALTPSRAKQSRVLIPVEVREELEGAYQRYDHLKRCMRDLEKILSPEATLAHQMSGTTVRNVSFIKRVSVCTWE